MVLPHELALCYVRLFVLGKKVVKLFRGADLGK